MAQAERLHDEQIARLDPFRRRGFNAFQDFWGEMLEGPGRVQDVIGDFEASPGYQFRQDEARRGIEAAANARGNFFSGGTLQAIGDRQQDVASNEYGNWYNRRAGEYYNWLGGLSGMGQMGMNAAAGQGSAGVTFGNQSMNALANMGDAQAAGAVGQANAFNTGLNNAFQMYGYMNQPSAANFNVSPSNPAFFSGLY